MSHTDSGKTLLDFNGNICIHKPGYMEGGDFPDAERMGNNPPGVFPSG